MIRTDLSITARFSGTWSVGGDEHCLLYNEGGDNSAGFGGIEILPRARNVCQDEGKGRPFFDFLVPETLRGQCPRLCADPRVYDVDKIKVYKPWFHEVKAASQPRPQQSGGRLGHNIGAVKRRIQQAKSTLDGALELDNMLWIEGQKVLREAEAAGAGKSAGPLSLHRYSEGMRVEVSAVFHRTVGTAVALKDRMALCREISIVVLGDLVHYQRIDMDRWARGCVPALVRGCVGARGWRQSNPQPCLPYAGWWSVPMLLSGQPQRSW